MNTYTKLRSGAWGVRCEGKVKSGDRVTVRKKSGETRTESVERVVWTDGKISLCSIVAETRQTRRQAPERQDCRKYGWDGVVGSPSYYSSGQYDEDS